MAFLLRQIVAGPRSRHAEADLDLCYVTSQIIATSGPSGRYPQRAYRNPLDQFVKFMDQSHGKNWAIWEFRAEGAGYPDEEVHGRVLHYPWPDHHPPPFRLVPIIMAGIKKWLEENPDGEKNDKRVVVLHCKAGKGRSGTIVCSYLISECGWKQEEALARFTERRMRPGFGQGVSIPSQLRWVGYVDRWTQCNKKYVDRKIEILELNVTGLRNGVKVQVRGFIDEGKTIKSFHTFTKKERIVAGDYEIDKNRTASDIRKQSRIGSPMTDIKVQKSANSPNKSDDEAGGSAVILKPSSPIIIPTSDINIDFERRSKCSIGWKVVTSLAHVWFNCFFEGQGPEKDGQPNETGVFQIEWDKMDGIKGSSRKGARAFDRLAVVWRTHHPDKDRNGKEEFTTLNPKPDTSIQQMSAANGEVNKVAEEEAQRDLGLKAESTFTTDLEGSDSSTGEKKSQ